MRFDVPRSELRDTVSARARLGVRDRWILVAILLAAVLVRLAVIWMPSDQMLENGGLPFEEVMRGNAALDFQNGRLLPLLDYQTNHFSGGSLVVSILAVPLFLVFGPVFPVLRLVSLCFSIPLVALMFVLVDRWKGRRAAWTATLLIAFAPPGYQFLNCTVYGTHLEGNLVTLALVFLYLAWRERVRPSWRATFVLGLASGFAVWFGYGQCVVLSVLIAIEWAASGWRALWRHALPLVTGFVVGLGPWIAYMLQHPAQVFRIYDHSLVDHFSSAAYLEEKLVRIEHLFQDHAPRAFWLHREGQSGGSWLEHALVLAIVALLVHAVWSERRRLATLGLALVGRRRELEVSLRLISLLFVVAWLGLYVASDFGVESRYWIQGCRYFMPLFPFLAILAGLAVADVRSRPARLLASLMIVCIPTVNTLSTLAQVRPDRLAQHAHAPATSTMWHARMIVRRFGSNGPVLLDVVRRIDATRADPGRAELIEWIARGLASVPAIPAQDARGSGVEPAFAGDVLRSLAEEAPESCRPAFARHLALRERASMPR